MRAIDKLGFDIVRGCQLRCIGCPNSTLKPKIKKISVEDFGLCIRNIDVNYVKLFRLFNFGEPLLHEGLPEILLVVRGATFRTGELEISTNAQHHDFDVLAETLKTGALTRLVVSADGDGTPEDYERLRPPGKWHKLIEFLVRARKLRDRHAPQLQLITRTICTDPRHQRRWLEVLAPLGWSPQFRDWIHLPQAMANMTGRVPRVPVGVCSFVAPGNRLYVDWDGTVVPCCVHPNAAVFGNLKESAYSEIFGGAPRSEFVRLLATQRPSMTICNECEF